MTVLIAVGGGITGDVSWLMQRVYLKEVFKFVNIPTTLLVSS